jgi:NADP-dependent 3-hydroxy acid dehydrogenase YdfG
METRRQITQEDRRCLTIAGDIGDEQFCVEAVKQTLQEFQRIDLLVNSSTPASQLKLRRVLCSWHRRILPI